MKIRNGFVSNSSSSSFIVLRKDPSLSFDELKNRSVKVINDYCDYDEEDQKYVNEEAETYAKDGKYILLKERVEYGGEEAVDKVVSKLLEALGINRENISFEWGE